jgi:hypothetical protein
VAVLPSDPLATTQPHPTTKPHPTTEHHPATDSFPADDSFPEADRPPSATPTERPTDGPPNGIRVLPDGEALVTAMRETLVDQHLAPMLDNIRARVNLGRRTLWGSVASGVAHGLSRAAPDLPVPAFEAATGILAALGLDDLVELAPLGGSEAGLSIQRKTCCLAFTLPEPTVCLGCCIR